MNWPIAHEVAGILLTYPKEMVPHIRNVFGTNDYLWVFWCLEYLVKELPWECNALLKRDLIRLAETPTEDEILEEVDKKATEILNVLK